MGYISKSGIANGPGKKVIDADHILRVIRALSGESSDDIKIVGKFEIGGRVFIGAAELLATATELNGLHERTPGVTVANKPLIPGDDKDLDELRVESLSVGNLILDHPEVGNVMGKIYAYNNFV